MKGAAKSAFNFLMRNKESKPEFKEAFQETGLAKRQSIGMPLTFKLTLQEETELQKLLVDYFEPSQGPEENVTKDYEELKTITEEVKSISAQSILLHGERIKKAEELLKDYREGAFNKWMLTTYGNRQTPYSMLRYYELYHELNSSDLRKKMEAMPKKAVYTLAFRSGSHEQKREIIENYSGEKQKALILEIQSRFPAASDSKKKPDSPNGEDIKKMFSLFEAISKRKASLTNQNRDDLEFLSEQISELINSK